MAAAGQGKHSPAISKSLVDKGGKEGVTKGTEGRDCFGIGSAEAVCSSGRENWEQVVGGRGREHTCRGAKSFSLTWCQDHLPSKTPDDPNLLLPLCPSFPAWKSKQPLLYHPQALSPHLFPFMTPSQFSYSEEQTVPPLPSIRAICCPVPASSSEAGGTEWKGLFSSNWRPWEQGLCCN